MGFGSPQFLTQFLTGKDRLVRGAFVLLMSLFFTSCLPGETNTKKFSVRRIRSNQNQKPGDTSPIPPGGQICSLSSPQVYALTQNSVTNSKEKGPGSLSVFLLEKVDDAANIKVTVLAEKNLTALPQSGEISADGNQYGWTTQSNGGKFNALPIVNSQKYSLGNSDFIADVATPISVTQNSTGLFATSWNNGVDGYYEFSTPIAPSANAMLNRTDAGPHDVKAVNEKYNLVANWSSHTVQLVRSTDHAILHTLTIPGNQPAPRWIKQVDESHFIIVGQRGVLAYISLQNEKLTVLDTLELKLAISNLDIDPRTGAMVATFGSTAIEYPSSGVLVTKITDGKFSPPVTHAMGTGLRDVLYLEDGVFVVGEIKSELIYFRLDSALIPTKMFSVPVNGAEVSLSKFQKKICMDSD